MESTENRPARRRLTEEELGAALRHDLSIGEAIGHRSIDVLLAYRREVNDATGNAARKLLGPDGRRTGPELEQTAQTTRRGRDTAKQYMQMHDACRLPTDEDTNGQ
ncbi:hypothetical protein ACI78Q_00290 [Geodermatophilus sp. SYSU D00705]